MAEGIWTRWKWAGHRLEVCRSRFGCHPLFDVHTPDAWDISPTVHVLIEHGAFT